MVLLCENSLYVCLEDHCLVIIRGRLSNVVVFCVWAHTFFHISEIKQRVHESKVPGKNWKSKEEKTQMVFFSSLLIRTAAAWGAGFGKGGCDSETVGEMSFQQWRKLLSDSDCGFSLFAIMDKQTGSQRVGFGGRRHAFLRGGEHRSRVVLRWGSWGKPGVAPVPPEACEHVSPLMSDWSVSILCLPSEGNPNQRSSFFFEEVRGQGQLPWSW